MVKGTREFLTCPSCKKRFTYWLLESNPHPKVKCYYCAQESFPKGEPPAASPPAAPAAKAPAAPPAPPEPPSA
ncbi:MAG TPA: hypothetical protein VL084_01100 [Thermoanaerobaculia bacterium]|nr:hypothetical protein [Thermoanaerobaculia bacterium]